MTPVRAETLCTRWLFHRVLPGLSAGAYMDDPAIARVSQSYSGAGRQRSEPWPTPADADVDPGARADPGSYRRARRAGSRRRRRGLISEARSRTSSVGAGPAGRHGAADGPHAGRDRGLTGGGSSDGRPDQADRKPPQAPRDSAADRRAAPPPRGTHGGDSHKGARPGRCLHRRAPCPGALGPRPDSRPRRPLPVAEP